MKKNNLSEKGLSMSQAQTISNLCNQKAEDIKTLLHSTNNSSKTVRIDGEDLTIVEGKPLPNNTIELICQLGEIRACQAFLMENIKAKNDLLIFIRNERINTSDIDIPVALKFEKPKFIEPVNEYWGFEQLLSTELNDYYEAEALASTIGTFIHKDKHLDNLRKELPNIPSVEWMEVEKDKKTAIKIVKHHNQDELMKIHMKLVNLHKKHEQRVNYYKAKVKNLVSDENARIARINSNAQSEVNLTNEKLRQDYSNAKAKYDESIKKLKQDFEADRLNRLKKAAALRINIAPKFQKIIDEMNVDEK